MSTTTQPKNKMAHTLACAGACTSKHLCRCSKGGDPNARKSMTKNSCRIPLLQLFLVTALSSSLPVTAAASLPTTEQHIHKNNPNHLRHKSNHHINNRQLTETITNRIVGGTPVTNPNQFPFFFEWEDAKCGASLIHDDIALSAAHCESESNPFATRLFMLGVNTEEGLFRTVERQMAHPLYSGEMKDYDFLILKLHQSALVNEQDGTATGAQVVALNRNPTIPAVGDALTAMGYGKVDANAEETSSTLQQVEIYYVSDDICVEQYGVTEFLSELMFCAAVPGGGRDTCQGDSGGPIIHVETNTQVGAVSFGIGCAEPSYSGVNARVSSVVDWIDDMICQLSDYPPPRCNGNGGNNPQYLQNTDTLPSGGLGAMAVHVQYDQYPKETAWSLTYLGPNTNNNANGNGMSTQDPIQLFFQHFHRDDLQPNAYQLETFDNLPAGLYNLQFGDEAGDSICCSYGPGGFWVTDESAATGAAGTTLWTVNTDSYTVYVGVVLEIDSQGVSRVISEDYDYKNSWETSVTVNHPPSYDQEWPGPVPATDRFAINVNVKFDAYPDEITWQLMASMGGNGAWSSVRSFEGASEGLQNKLVSVEIPSLTPGWYKFWINDKSGDGVCCTFRRGWVSLTAPIITTRDKGLVWGNNGEFGNQIEVFALIDEEGFVDQVHYSDPTVTATARQRRNDPGSRQRQRQRQLSVSASYTDLAGGLPKHELLELQR